MQQFFLGLAVFILSTLPTSHPLAATPDKPGGYVIQAFHTAGLNRNQLSPGPERQ